MLHTTLPQQWATLRAPVTSDDTLLTDLKPSDFATGKGQSVYPYTAMAIRGYGRDTDNDNATVQISGWMDNTQERGVGPGQVLWKGQVTLGSITWTEKPIDDANWNTTAAYFEVDTWDSGVAGGVNAPPAVLASGGNHSLLILPTLGYTYIQAEVADLGGAGEMTQLGLIFRRISLGGVI